MRGLETMQMRVALNLSVMPHLDSIQKNQVYRANFWLVVRSDALHQDGSESANRSPPDHTQLG